MESNRQIRNVIEKVRSELIQCLKESPMFQELTKEQVGNIEEVSPL